MKNQKYVPAIDCEIFSKIEGYIYGKNQIHEISRTIPVKKECFINKINHFVILICELMFSSDVDKS